MERDATLSQPAPETAQKTHTPAPWRWDGDSIVGPDDAVVLHLDYTHATHGNPDLVAPNSRNEDLIIAAPDLLAALERLLAFVPVVYRNDPICEQARAAIAKARGEA